MSKLKSEITEDKEVLRKNPFIYIIFLCLIFLFANLAIVTLHACFYGFRKCITKLDVVNRVSKISVFLRILAVFCSWMFVLLQLSFILTDIFCKSCEEYVDLSVGLQIAFDITLFFISVTGLVLTYFLNYEIAVSTQQIPKFNKFWTALLYPICFIPSDEDSSRLINT